MYMKRKFCIERVTVSEILVFIRYAEVRLNTTFLDRHI